IQRTRSRKRRRKDPALAGLMPPSLSAEHLGPLDYYYWDSFWSLRGLRDAAALIRDDGQTELAAQVDGWATSFAADLDASMHLVANRLGPAVTPAGPRRHVDAAVIGSLAACWPLQIFGTNHPGITATLAAIQDRFCIDRAFFQAISHTGLGTY